MSTAVQTSYPEEGMIQAVWPSFTSADAAGGLPVQFGRYGCKSVQATGTWGNATLVIEGSNDGVTWFTLKDPAAGEGGEDAAISFTANGLAEISPNTKHIRPRLSSAGSGAELKIIIIGAR